MSYQNFVMPNTGTGGGWREKMADIQARRETLRRHGAIMSQFEMLTIQEDLKRRTESAYQVVANGALAEHRATLELYKAAQAKVKDAQAAEVKRWQSGKLNEELAMAQVLVNLSLQAPGAQFGRGVSQAQRVEAILRDAKLSGDQHKLRAVCEVLQTVKLEGLPPEVRLEVNHLTHQAAAELESLRVTDEMHQAAEVEAQARAQVAKSRQMLAEVYETLKGAPIDSGFNAIDPDELAKAYRQARLDENGDILPESDSWARGVDIQIKEN